MHATTPRCWYDRAERWRHARRATRRLHRCANRGIRRPESAFPRTPAPSRSRVEDRPRMTGTRSSCDRMSTRVDRWSGWKPSRDSWCHPTGRWPRCHVAPGNRSIWPIAGRPASIAANCMSMARLTSAAPIGRNQQRLPAGSTAHVDQRSIAHHGGKRGTIRRADRPLVGQRERRTCDAACCLIERCRQ